MLSAYRRISGLNAPPHVISTSVSGPLVAQIRSIGSACLGYWARSTTSYVRLRAVGQTDVDRGARLQLGQAEERSGRAVPRHVPGQHRGAGLPGRRAQPVPTDLGLVGDLQLPVGLEADGPDRHVDADRTGWRCDAGAGGRTAWRRDRPTPARRRARSAATARSSVVGRRGWSGVVDPGAPAAADGGGGDRCRDRRGGTTQTVRSSTATAGALAGGADSSARPASRRRRAARPRRARRRRRARADAGPPSWPRARFMAAVRGARGGAQWLRRRATSSPVPVRASTPAAAASRTAGVGAAVAGEASPVLTSVGEPPRPADRLGVERERAALEAADGVDDEVGAGLQVDGRDVGDRARRRPVRPWRRRSRRPAGRPTPRSGWTGS